MSAFEAEDASGPRSFSVANGRNIHEDEEMVNDDPNRMHQDMRSMRDSLSFGRRLHSFWSFLRQDLSFQPWEVRQCVLMTLFDDLNRCCCHVGSQQGASTPLPPCFASQPFH